MTTDGCTREKEESKESGLRERGSKPEGEPSNKASEC